MVFQSQDKELFQSRSLACPPGSSSETDSAELLLPGDVPVQTVISIASVVISLSNGVELSKNHLSYPELLQLVEKLEYANGFWFEEFLLPASFS